MSRQPQSTPPSAPAHTDTAAALGLVFAFAFWPLGIVLSAVGLRRTTRDGTGGHDMARAGLTLSIVFGALTILVPLGIGLVAALSTLTGH